METIFTKDNPFNIIFVGRLEKEKGAELLMECIRKTMIHTTFNENVRWHIVGSGSYSSELKTLSNRFEKKIIMYGQRPRDFILSLMPKMQLSFVPSIFLETFGLVALESLMQNVLVCGFKKGGLTPFILDSLALKDEDDSDGLLKILESIMENGFPQKPNLDIYSISLWREELKLVVKEHKKILIINDYLEKIGGTEIYIALLKEELLALGKNVRIIGYYGSVPKWKRAFLQILSAFSFWHERWIMQEIASFNPDLIWMHNTERYIGPWGIRAIINSGKDTVITHHDLGLITTRPSRITEESQIPKSLNFKDFIGETRSPIEIFARVGKYLTLRIFWIYLKKIPLHLVPSEFMKDPIEKFGAKQVEVFPHSIR